MTVCDIYIEIVTTFMKLVQICIMYCGIGEKLTVRNDINFYMI